MTIRDPYENFDYNKQLRPLPETQEARDEEAVGDGYVDGLLGAKPFGDGYCYDAGYKRGAADRTAGRY
ncbi:hypothetical protein HNR60_001599 [Rhodopseudomonas rhenobacensis]|uniref:Uncharacterized protein n=1 Tax=Rhodopseudomonas rhenobacensis TaxID=87461 RepID=A0A7W8DYH4_9BRAD|nr:hypothetical protein [Rhodopseudomonas rhenobacensis]MBB5046850.1 hypothetical protein [Rhodopseudomonas rhenobacensis]